MKKIPRLIRGTDQNYAASVRKYLTTQLTVFANDRGFSWVVSHKMTFKKCLNRLSESEAIKLNVSFLNFYLFSQQLSNSTDQDCPTKVQAPMFRKAATSMKCLWKLEEIIISSNINFFSALLLATVDSEALSNLNREKLSIREAWIDGNSSFALKALKKIELEGEK